MSKLHHHQIVEASQYRQGQPILQYDQATRSIVAHQGGTLAHSVFVNAEARAVLHESVLSQAIILGRKIWNSRPRSLLIWS
jgi:hypothetical protein